MPGQDRLHAWSPDSSHPVHVVTCPWACPNSRDWSLHGEYTEGESLEGWAGPGPNPPPTGCGGWDWRGGEFGTWEFKLPAALGLLVGAKPGSSPWSESHSMVRVPFQPPHPRGDLSFDARVCLLAGGMACSGVWALNCCLGICMSSPLYI